MSGYSHRGGRRYGAVVAGNRIASGRFVYLSKTKDMQDSWRIRDFIGNQILSSDDSNLTLAGIESLVENWDDRSPPKYNAEEKPDEWRDYLILRSREIFGKDFDSHSPPVLQGPWKPL